MQGLVAATQAAVLVREQVEACAAGVDVEGCLSLAAQHKWVGPEIGANRGMAGRAGQGWADLRSVGGRGGVQGEHGECRLIWVLLEMWGAYSRNLWDASSSVVICEGDLRNYDLCGICGSVWDQT